MRWLLHLNNRALSNFLNRLFPIIYRLSAELKYIVVDRILAVGRIAVSIVLYVDNYCCFGCRCSRNVSGLRGCLRRQIC